jgi:hypothetical protein
MATLIYPFAPSGTFDPADVWVERVDLKDEAAVGYRVKSMDREDLIILSDGAYRSFTEKIEGDFTYARITTDANGVHYAGFTGVSRFVIDGVPGQSFAAKQDFEYQR